MKKLSRKKIITWTGKLFLKLICLLLLFTVSQVIILRFLNPFTTPNIAYEWVESIWEKDKSKRPVYIWKDLDQISPHLRKAVIAAEDQRFLLHNGFDINEIKSALKTLINRQRVRGASTISMQTARSVFWLSSRSLTRKTVEVYYTILIETFWEKPRILEMYLNTVDWGTSVTGAEAAARKYFSKSAKNLSAEEAALMTAILPNPHRWSASNPSPYIKKRQIQIMKIMTKMPLIKH